MAKTQSKQQPHLEETLLHATVLIMNITTPDMSTYDVETNSSSILFLWFAFLVI